MDEDFDPIDDTTVDDEYDQDGPDLFGEETPSPVSDPAYSVEATPEEDVVDDAEEPSPLDGPESPIEPDGLESEEDDVAPGTDGLAERVEELTRPADLPADDVPEAPLALYRRYRPETFDEVIGQEHVTEPLKRAIVNNRVNHAYLFSGPRGCGKTTSARILARCLNCEQGPTPQPCGTCQSCRDLARGGPGSIDVIEIDAASHGGVDDARDLRERAFFAPVHSRYKIYIIDEAHMVTTQGFNALLKLVEEPPPHVKFIFATTEPDKVIGTIRSRTHHYPFRLVPPKTLVAYLETLCEQEGIHVDHAVLPLVVRAGGGSVRDSLSVLDQLLGGADEDGVSYDQAAALLGYTPDALLDRIVDAFAAGDAHEVFAAIDKVIEVGQDPRRFAEDLLRRMRDLVIIAAVPDAVRTGLIDVSPEQATRLSHQAAGLGAGELTRSAEVLATGLTQMRGTTAPRLHLELMCSRILLPGADVDDRGVHARLDRLERRVGIVGVDDAGSVQTPASEGVPGAVPQGTPSPSVTQDQAPEPAPRAPQQRPRPRPRPAAAAPERPPSAAAPTGQAARHQPGRPPASQAPAPQPQESPALEPQSQQGGGAPGGVDITTLRREWPRILDVVRGKGRFLALVLGQYSHVVEVHGNRVTLGFANPGARDSLNQADHATVLHDAVVEVLGADLTFVPVLADGGPGGPGGGPGATAPSGRAAERSGRGDAPDPRGPGAGSEAAPGHGSSSSGHGQSEPRSVSGTSGGPGSSSGQGVGSVRDEGPDSSPDSASGNDSRPEEASGAVGGPASEKGPSASPEGGSYPASARSHFLAAARRQAETPARRATAGSGRGDASLDGSGAAVVPRVPSRRADSLAPAQPRSTGPARSTGPIRGTGPTRGTGLTGGTVPAGGPGRPDALRQAPEPPPEPEEVPPDEDLDEVVVDAPRESAVELIMSELGGVVLGPGERAEGR